MSEAESLFLSRFAPPSNSRRRRRRRRGRPLTSIPSRLPGRPTNWRDDAEVRLYVIGMAAAVVEDVTVIRAVERLVPQDALLRLAHLLLRRHDDQVRRARRGARQQAASRIWQATKLLFVVGRLASDAALAQQSYESLSHPGGSRSS